MVLGSMVSVIPIPVGFHMTKCRKLFCPSSCHVTPLNRSIFPPLSLILSLSVSHVVLLSVLSAHSLAPALMFLISLI